MYCHKCQFVCDETDAFCRKCGATLAEEGQFSETTVTALEVLESHLPVKATARKLPMYLAKAGELLSSETGQKLAKGAMVVALSVAAEIIDQAMKQDKKRKLERMSPGEVVRSLSPLDNGFSSPILSNGMSETYDYFYERWIIRRTIRRE
ncbi:hypothetical protein [Candidatus Chlorohelix sp.]|uniref:hypothetical protein n=1 Tax=Candidatus Chlorohelix sp. TaxID=3139201 RepID=UPI00306B929B